jgi:mycothiol S-conjugate amidase
MTPQPATFDLSHYGITSHWRWQQQADRRILFVYAHPDDESFGNAGTILHYSMQGVAVHYACATRGEVGTIDPQLLKGFRDAAELRTGEQLRAAEALDLAAVHFLNHRDSGMQGTPENQHPQALVQQPREQVAAQIVALIRTLRPQVVVTFNPYGGYGHPDHIACHHATLLAFDAAADPSAYPDQIAQGLQPWRATRLYFSTFPPGFLKLMILVLRLLRRDPRRFGRNNDVDLVRILDEITPATTLIDTKAHLERKEQAWIAHKSQGGGRRFGWLPAFIRQYLSAREQFSRVRPHWPGGSYETDLFGEGHAS